MWKMHETIVHLSNDFSLHTSAENYLVVFLQFFGIDDCNVFFYCFSSITTISCVTNSSSRVIEQINEGCRVGIAILTQQPGFVS